MKKIDERKLQAFAIGAMGKRPITRMELEKQKKREDEVAVAHVFKEFVETFQEAPNPYSKVWVKAGTYDAGSGKEDYREKGKLYKPSFRLIEKKASSDKAQECAKLLTSKSKKEALSSKMGGHEKKKSNMEFFKKELRQIQEEREERRKYKTMARQTVPQDTETTKKISESKSFDNGDPNTTNLYLGNLSPKISEQKLIEIFGRYGKLASIKIMWPRTEEEKTCLRNCGFVAYMSRKDAESALRNLNGCNILGYDLELYWGKPVPIPKRPINIPPTLFEYTLPPPPSGLPFKDQPPSIEVNAEINDQQLQTSAIVRKCKRLLIQYELEEQKKREKEEAASHAFEADPNTTNLFLGNLSPKISEQLLMQIFGRYGKLASIRIICPRSEEKKTCSRNCGFVAYMSRKDAESALRNLNGRNILGYDLELYWGKPIPIPKRPINISPTLLEYTLPPPPSGLPFNAQPPPNEVNAISKYVKQILQMTEFF